MVYVFDDALVVVRPSRWSLLGSLFGRFGSGLVGLERSSLRRKGAVLAALGDAPSSASAVASIPGASRTPVSDVRELRVTFASKWLVAIGSLGFSLISPGYRRKFPRLLVTTDTNKQGFSITNGDRDQIVALLAPVFGQRLRVDA